jgi:uncharacterized CHY-type Zn-finger protein
MSEETYYCFSCDGEIEGHLVEKAKKTNKYSGLCQWCKDLQRNFKKVTEGKR